MGKLVQIICLALAMAPAIVLVSSQEVLKNPDFCSQYQNMSDLFNNTNSTVNTIILGFQEETWFPFEEQESSPCVYLTDTENRQIFVQVQTTGQLCIDIDTASVCGSGTIELCDLSAVTSASALQYVYFTCQGSCSTSSVPLLYRVIQSANTGNLEYWCDEIAGAPNNVYPQDVIFDQFGGTAVSFSRDFEETSAPIPDSAHVVISCLIMVSLLALIVLSFN